MCKPYYEEVVEGSQVLSAKCYLSECKESNPFQAKLNNTSVYCLNGKVYSDMMAVKGEKELCKQG